MSEPQQEVVSALAGRMALTSEKAPGRSSPVRDDRTGETLLQRVAVGDGEALRGLAERMAPRVRHVARALMGRSLDADDAALHALIELLRAHPQYRGGEPLDRWVDRLAALSVLRFARAVRKRTPPGRASAAPWGEGRDARDARTFEQYLRVLSETSREVLLLRHALGFRVVDLPDALRCSTRSAKERLLAARRELRGLVRRRADQEVGAGAQRWCALRDLEAVDEPLSEAEQSEIAQLEASEPEIWAYVAQVRALELYFAAHGEPLRDEDRALVEAALSSVRITAHQVLGRALDGEAELDRSAEGEGEGDRWAQLVAVSGSTALALGCVVALLMREPGHARGALVEGRTVAARAPDAQLAPAAQPSEAFQPTVESLASAQTAARGGRLRRAGRLLPAGVALGQGDVVASTERPGCIVVGAQDALCLASNSEVRVVSLSRKQPRIELLRGRLVASGDDGASSARLEVQSGEWLVANASGGVVAVERGGDLASLRVRALRGHSRLTFAEHAHMLAPAYAALLQTGQSAPAVVALPQLVAQRDWELLATLGKPGLLPSSLSIARSNAPTQLDENPPAPGAERAAELVTSPGSAVPSALGSAEVASSVGVAAPGRAPTAVRAEAPAAPTPSTVSMPTMPAAAAALAELEAPSAGSPVSERAKRAAAAVDDILLERSDDTPGGVEPRPE